MKVHSCVRAADSRKNHMVTFRMHTLEDTSTPFTVGVAILGYSLCSSTLLLANKLAIAYLPSPTAISFLQILFSTVAVYALQFLGVTVDHLEWEKIKPYSIYVLLFVASVYTNMKTLGYANVETVIVFRACSPIVVSLVEHFFMDRQLPNFRSSVALITVAIGAMVYCIAESQNHKTSSSVSDMWNAYFWATIYLVLITAEMTYGKQITGSVKMESVWGPVLYCNALAVIPMFLIGHFEGDFGLKLLQVPALNVTAQTVLLFSCIVGTLIGYTAWYCRGMVSATTFTLVGVVNKFLTILLNVFIWDKHSTPLGLVAVCICLLAGTFYQQAPRRDIKHATETLPQTTPGK